MLRLCRIVMGEYYGLNEKVLIESPFAEITEDGDGVRQVQLALTHKYILIGEDRFDKEETESLSNVYPKSDLEPEIETMHLVEIIPLKAIRIKIYRREKRELLKIIAGNYVKIMYFEFGGHLLKRMNWCIWKDRIDNMKISHNRYSKHMKYKDPYTEFDTPLTSNSEYEKPKKFNIFVDIHSKNEAGKYQNNVQEKTNQRSYNNNCTQEKQSLLEETLQTVQRYFVDAITNAKLNLLDKKFAAYTVLKTSSEPNYVVDLSHNKKYTEEGFTLNRKSASTGLIRSKR